MCVAALVTPGCVFSTFVDGIPDAGSPDPLDAGDFSPDVTPRDALTWDALTWDLGTRDATPRDATPRDALPFDVDPPDSGLHDSSEGWETRFIRRETTCKMTTFSACWVTRFSAATCCRQRS